MDFRARVRNLTPYADLVEPASLLVLEAPNLYRDILQELDEGVGRVEMF
jgi:hypothetical protein